MARREHLEKWLMEQDKLERFFDGGSQEHPSGESVLAQLAELVEDDRQGLLGAMETEFRRPGRRPASEPASAAFSAPLQAQALPSRDPAPSGHPLSLNRREVSGVSLYRGGADCGL